MFVTGVNNGNGDTTDAEEQAKLTEATQLFMQCGFPASMFTVQNLINEYYFVHQFLKLIKPFSSIKDKQDLARTLTLAVPTYWHSPDSATIRNLIEFVKWLKTDAGKAKLSVMYTQRRLERKGGGEYLSIIDVAAVKMANVQLLDYSVHRKKFRVEFEAEMKAELEALRDQFSPMADYEPPTQGEVEVAAYDLYMRDSEKKKLRYLDRGDEGYAMAVKFFGSIARDQHMAKWINEGDRVKVLMDYCKQKAVYLNGIWKLKQANKLRNLVVVAGGEEALDAAVVYEFEFESPESSRGVRKRKATGAIETMSAAVRARAGGVAGGAILDGHHSQV